MKKEETINLDSIWIDVVKAIDNIKNFILDIFDLRHQ